MGWRWNILYASFNSSVSGIEACTIIKPWHIQGGSLLILVLRTVLGSQQRLGRSLKRNTAHPKQMTYTGLCNQDCPRIWVWLCYWKGACQQMTVLGSQPKEAPRRSKPSFFCAPITVLVTRLAGLTAGSAYNAFPVIGHWKCGVIMGTWDLLSCRPGSNL